MARAFLLLPATRQARRRAANHHSFPLAQGSSKSEWTGQELYVCARLLEDIHSYPESARYYFALYNSKA